MALACSLYQDARAYRFSYKEALWAPIMSPYAIRHLRLANRSDTPFLQKWGHRIIAAVQLIPIVGLLASLIERIICLVGKWLNSKPLIQQDYFKPFSSTTLASNSSLQRKGLAQAIVQNTLSVTSSTLVQSIVPSQAQIEDAEILIDFCKHISGGSAFNHLDPIAQSASLRTWLANDPAIAEMKELILVGKGIKAIPPEISFFKRLGYLSLNDNDLTSFPAEIRTLSRLWTLCVKNNQLTSFPIEICALTTLQQLDVSDNKLDGVPAEISHLTKLWCIFLGNNQLTFLPVEICNLPNLTVLHLDNNQLTDLPDEIWHLKLYALDVSFNRLTTLPTLATHIDRQAGLWSLRVNGNQLDSLPAEIGNLLNLKELHVGVRTTIPAIPPKAQIIRI